LTGRRVVRRVSYSAAGVVRMMIARLIVVGRKTPTSEPYFLHVITPAATTPPTVPPRASKSHRHRDRDAHFGLVPFSTRLRLENDYIASLRPAKVAIGRGHSRTSRAPRKCRSCIAGWNSVGNTAIVPAPSLDSHAEPASTPRGVSLLRRKDSPHPTRPITLLCHQADATRDQQQRIRVEQGGQRGMIRIVRRSEQVADLAAGDRRTVERRMKIVYALRSIQSVILDHMSRTPYPCNSSRAPLR